MTATPTELNLDLAALREVVASGPRALFATVSGAHLYGFPSPDSDVDLRGAFVAPLREVLRLAGARETFEFHAEREVGGRLLDVDWVAHDLIKFARLLAKPNGYVLEQLTSPLVVWGGPWLDELRALAEGLKTRRHVHHYRGFLANQRRLLTKEQVSAKALLYAYRVALTGIHLLRTGEVEANLVTLDAAQGPISGLDALLERKREGERAPLAPAEVAAHEAALDRLEQALEEAVQASPLPEAPAALDALDDYVVRARLELGQ